MNRATALLNKNTIPVDRNTFITRSNVKNDEHAMRRRVMEALLRSADMPSTVTPATVLAKRMLRAVSASTSDAALVTQAAAVVAAVSRGGEAPVFVQHIDDLVDAVVMREMGQEDAIRIEMPRSVRVLVSTKDVVRRLPMPTAPSHVSRREGVLQGPRRATW
jgi:hypothetical protein